MTPSSLANMPPSAVHVHNTRNAAQVAVRNIGSSRAITQDAIPEPAESLKTCSAFLSIRSSAVCPSSSPDSASSPLHTFTGQAVHADLRVQGYDLRVVQYLCSVGLW